MCNFFVPVGKLTLSNKELEQQLYRYVDLSGAGVRISPVAWSWVARYFVYSRPAVKYTFFTRSKQGMSSRDRRHSQLLSPYSFNIDWLWLRDPFRYPPHWAAKETTFISVFRWLLLFLSQSPFFLFLIIELKRNRYWS